MDSWFSCQSCHTDGHTNGLLTDNLGDGSFGAAKRVLTLLGGGETGPWSWNGHVARLESQVETSIVSTMQGQPPDEATVADLAAYLRTLPAPPPLGPLQGDDPAAAARGEIVFAARGCADCHAGPTYTTPAIYDVGTRDKLGQSQFNPPSLRGVSQGGPYLHDGRAATLEELFSVHRHPPGEEIPPGDLADFVVFLRSL
jgi:cytochrome c peroxidase